MIRAIVARVRRVVCGARWPVARRPRRQMPNPKEMSGVPLPAPDLPAGTVSVRVVRGSFANNVAESAGRVHRRRQDADGEDRRERPRAGDRAQAGRAACRRSTVVDGERLESQEITIGADAAFASCWSRSIRTRRSARPRTSALAAGPAVKGIVVLRARVAHRRRVRRRPAEHLLRPRHPEHRADAGRSSAGRSSSTCRTTRAARRSWRDRRRRRRSNGRARHGDRAVRAGHRRPCRSAFELPYSGRHGARRAAVARALSQVDRPRRADRRARPAVAAAHDQAGESNDQGQP